MARVYKQKVTRPLPRGAKVTEKDGKRVAQWKGKDGRIRKAPINESGRIVDETNDYWCEYTDATGVLHRVPTGCRNKDAAEAFRADILKRQERRRAGIFTAEEEKAADAANIPVTQHIETYAEWLVNTKKTAGHANTRRAYLLKLIEQNGWVSLSNMDRDGLERSMRSAQDGGRSARTANAIRESALAFGNWALKKSLITANPFAGVAKVNQAVDPRRQRRALTMDEVQRLLVATETRPLHDAQMKNRGKDAAKLSERTLTHLKTLGRERRLAYHVMVLTGLRLGELRAIRVCDVILDSDSPHINLRASITKNRKDSDVPLREELVTALQAWLEGKPRQIRKSETLHPGSATGNVLDNADAQNDLLFRLPEKMTRVFDRDLAFAGIPKRGHRNLTVDIHCLRHTFCTWLTESGIPLQTAQRLMRHSDPKLTAAVYTHHTNKALQNAVAQLPKIGPNESTADRPEHGQTDAFLKREALPDSLPDSLPEMLADGVL